MKKVQNLGLALFVGILMIFWAQMVLAQMQMGEGMSEGESKMADGIKATFNVTLSMSMVDVFVIDAATMKPIQKAKVSVSVKGPDGKVQEKDLIWMKMAKEKEYAYGNTVDFSRKGKYSFDVLVEADKKKVKFNFGHEIR